MTPAIALRGVAKHYPDFSLHELSLELPAGQVMGLVGVNGAGKSTLMRILMGLVKADRGEVEVCGHRLPEAQVAAKRLVGYASDDMRLYRGQTLRWHMDFIRSIYPGWDEAYAGELVRRFDLRPQQALGGYSHGQRVKALLLLILARRPRLLLLDEPTTGLDPVARGEVLDALAEVLRDAERSVLFSSHNTLDVEQLSDTISFLHQGRLVASQDKESFLDQWRRVMCRGQWQPTAQQLPGLASVRSDGSMVELKFGRYEAGIPDRLLGLGLAVASVEPMNLEDIFVTTVRAGAPQ